MSPLIQLHQVTKTYSVSGRFIPALNQIDLSIDKGEWVTIMGQAKSGKSSLIHILGLLDHMTAGEYCYASEPLSTWAVKKRHATRDAQFGFLFPSPHLLPHVDVLNNVLLPLYYRGTPRAAAKEMARQALGRVLLSDLSQALPHALSKEEQQRVAIARALAHKPAVILADDPTAHLDAKATENIFHLLHALHAELQQTVVMVTQPNVMHQAKGRALRLVAGALHHG